ncbi:hypothetical protein DPM19_19140 [Actinomadura craniellae]|uniref:Uncharacterized protein n=2 Tax=Actinomadura craniellae TaxID=2231787 RepID=A0A365H3Z6_9ACTN|nr:hypothetical protein DPM19_19140 [Actinomadura craniellae]
MPKALLGAALTLGAGPVMAGAAQAVTPADPRPDQYDGFQRDRPRGGLLPGRHDGFSGYQIIRRHYTNVWGQQQLSATCPWGKRVIGGGGQVHGDGAQLISSYPGDARRWVVEVRHARAVTVYAICVREF